MSHYPPPMPQPPMPVQPVSYLSPYTAGGRPGVLTAVGVTSIVVACFTLVGSLFFGLMAFGFAMIAAKPAAFAPPPTVVQPMTAPPVVSGGLILAPEDGFQGSEVDVIVHSMNAKRSMNEARGKQLNVLITQAGKKIFPFEIGQITPQLVRSNITESGSIPGMGSGTGSNYYITGTGRVEVYDDHAIFRPDGSMDVVSVSAAKNDDGTVDDPSSANPQSAGGGVIPPTGKPAAKTRTATGTPVMGPPKISLGITGTMMAENILSALLAIYLGIIGIMVLRDSRSGGKLHWIYIWLKIPLVIVAAVAGAMFWHDLAAATSPGNPTAVPMFVVSALMGAAMALAYPVALMFVLKSRGVKNYYSPVVE